MEPNKIGIYEIKSELGRGGMATVYRAYDPRFEREVAIKVLPRELLYADPQFRLRFEREAKVIAQIEHAAIVPVYDVGEADGQPYFVMRYMNGGSLSDRMKAGLLPIEEAARILGAIAPALDEAHSVGIVHRDIKPSNILFDNRNNPYISDFGIAKLSQAQAGTTTGSAIIGTPAYMAPEQAQGIEIDGRIDIYALGIILYEMLTGRQPYEADTPMAVAIKHITDPVPHILNANPQLPPGMEAVIQKAMAKDRDARFSSSKEMINALHSVMSGERPKRQEVVTGTYNRPFVVRKSTPIPGKSKPFSGIALAALTGIVALIAIALISQISFDISAFAVRLFPFIGIGLIIGIMVVAAGYTAGLTQSYFKRRRLLPGPEPVERSPAQYQASSSMTYNVLAEIDPHKRQEILNLIGRDQELRLKDKITHFGGGRYLLHGYGRFGATALIDQIVNLAKYDLASQAQAQGSGVVITVRIDASTLHETDNGIDAVIQEFRLDAKRGNYSRSFTTQLNKLYKNKIAEIENSSKEHTIAIKVAPIPGISAEFARKTGQNLSPGKTLTTHTDLMEMIVNFLDRAEKQKPLLFESFAYKFMNSSDAPTRLIIVIDKIESETVFGILQRMKLFNDKRITFFAIVAQDLAWLDNPKIKKMLSDFGFELHYIPCLWEEETGFVEKLIAQAFTVKNKSGREQDFKDHIAFVARGSPGDAVREALRHEYCEFKLGIPILNLATVREWEMLERNAQIQRILCSNWERILSSWFKGASSFERDRAKRAIYEVVDWMNSRVVFTMPQVQGFAGGIQIKLSDTEIILQSVLKALISVLIEEKFLLSAGEYFGIAHRVKQEDLH